MLRSFLRFMILLVAMNAYAEHQRDEETEAQIGGGMKAEALPPLFSIKSGDMELQFGGFVKVDTTYDLEPLGTPDAFKVSQFPLGLPEQRKYANFNISGRPSRLMIDFLRYYPGENVRVHYENDFLSSTGNMDYRLRQFYAQYEHLTAGFLWTALYNGEASANTLDSSGPAGSINLRQAGMQYAISTGEKGNGIVFSLESPTTEATLPPNTTAVTRLPDMIVSYRLKQDWGSLRIGALLREVAVNSDLGTDQTMGYAGSISGGIKTIPGDRVLFALNGGRGFAHYLTDTSGTSSDAAYDTDGKLHALPTVGTVLSYRHAWDDNWKSSATYSMALVEPTSAEGRDAYRRSDYFAINLTRKFVPSSEFGLEVLYGKRKVEDGRTSEGTRFQFSLRCDLSR